MKKSIKILAICTLLCMLIGVAVPASALSAVDSNIGAQSQSEESVDYSDYIKITTKEELNAVRNDLGAKYVLMADIVFTSADFASGGAFYNGGAGWTPIGTQSNAFTGVFDGNGHTIQNLKINITSGTTVYAGLFGYVSSGAIKNLGMVDSVINVTLSSSSALYAYVGGIVGGLASYSREKIDNCYNTGNITVNATSTSNSAQAKVGGLVGTMDGYCYALLSNCRNSGNIVVTVEAAYSSGTAIATAGGIAGNVDGTVFNCSNEGDVSADATMTRLSYGNSFAGGIAGSCSGDISGCCNSGSINSTATAGHIAKSYIGGIVGNNTGTVSNCYNSGNSEATADATTTSSTSEANCYAGGISGYLGNKSEIANCYNAALLSATATCKSSNRPANKYVGGIAGYVYNYSSSSIVTNCYYLDVVGNGVSYGKNTAVSCSEDEMKQKETFSSFDFAGVWTMEGNAEYPYPELIYILDPDYCVEISTKEQLSKVGENRFGIYKLIDDIVFTSADFAEGGAFYNGGTGWQPICEDDDSGFTGVFDGNGHTICGLTIKATDSNARVGLFGCIDGGTVKNLGLLSSGIGSIKSAHGMAGSIAGEMSAGTISGCYSDISIEGKTAGGIVGIGHSGVISNCYNTGAVISKYEYNYDSQGNAGGIAGYTYQDLTVSGCYNTGFVNASATTNSTSSYTARAYAYGIAGYNCKVVNCFNTGNVIASATATSTAARAYAYAGGIAYMGTISGCYNTADIYAVVEHVEDCTSISREAYAAGISNSQYSAVVSDCFNTGDVLAVAPYKSVAGGVVGLSSGGEIRNCYSIGNPDASVSGVSGSDSAAAYSEQIIGCELYDNTTVSNCYYLLDESGEATAEAFGTACTKAELRDQATFSGFDFDTVWTMTGHEYYTYPELRGVEMVYEREFDSFEITALPTKTQYLEAKDKLDLTGGQLTVKYADGGTAVIDMSEATIGGFDNTIVGTQVLTVTYKENIRTFEVEIIAKQALSISITAMPDKLQYVEGKDTLDVTGGRIIAYYNNDTSAEIDLDVEMITGFDNSIVGEQTLTITHSGQTATYKIEVVHDYTLKFDESQHWEECSICADKKEKSAHVYDKTCDETCEGCDYVRDVTHSYTVLKQNMMEHWYECSVCGDEENKDREAHKGGVATCTERAACSVCNTFYGTLDINNHAYSTTLTQGDTTHYYECSRCENRKNEAAHEYTGYTSNGDNTHTGTCVCEKTDTNVCMGGAATCVDMAICSVCNTAYGTVDTNNHAYSSSLIQGDATHYYECSRCEDRKNEAAHDYTNYTSNGDNTHTGVCVCEKTYTNVCSGGMATCTEKAVCSTCNSAYGTADPSHDYSATLTQGENTHYYECSRCGERKSEAAHEYTGYTSNGDNTHAATCICGKTDTGACSGGMATCNEKAVCSVCNTAYGTVDTNNHAYSSDLIQGEATHYYECARCHARKGEEYHEHKNYISNGDNTHAATCICGKTDTGACSGGMATCNEKAVCSVCNTAYGTVDVNNHAYSSTLTQGDATHYYECARCHARKGEEYHEHKNYISSGDNTHAATCICGKIDTGACSGGVATCADRAVCSVCGTAYGSVDESNHNYASTLTQGDATHYYECSRCHGKKNEAAHGYKNYTSNGNDTHTGACICGRIETNACSGNDATATCQTKATCTICGGVYGSFASHDYGLTTWGYKGSDGHAHTCKTSGCTAHDAVVKHTSSGAATESTAETCTVCGYVITPATGHVHHDPVSEWSTDDTYHWKECVGCSDQELEKGAHVYDDACDATCNTCNYARPITHDYAYKSSDTEHWQECSSCKAEKPNSRDMHSGGNATCTDAAVCAYCSVVYGENDADNHSKSTYHYVTNGDGTHNKIYDCCNATADASEACSGGSATCQAKAICLYCDTAYGSVGAHNYDFSTWGYKAADGHAYVCKTSGCGAHDTVEAHVSSGAPTEESAEICVVCQYVINPALVHTTHTPKSEWSSDAENHWHECVGCSGQQLEMAEHIYDNACDTDCNTCAYVRDAEHSYTELKHSETEHWYECACGEKAENVQHAYGHDGVCDVCGYESKSQGGTEPPVTDAPPADPGTDPSDGKGDASGATIAIIVISFAVVLGGGGFALYWFVFRKKKFK